MRFPFLLVMKLMLMVPYLHIDAFVLDQDRRSGALVVPEDLRFSKVEFAKELLTFFGPTLLNKLPLSAKDYPLDIETYRWLRYTKTASLIVPHICIGCDYNSTDFIQAIGGPPRHPSSNMNDPYWDQLAHVVEMQHQRRHGVDPKTVMPLPDLWKNMTIDQIAKAVHDEYPGKWHVQLIENMANTKSIPSLDYNIIPFTCDAEFLRGICLISDMVTWAISRVGPMNFGVKYFVGRARPEEMVHKIATGELPAPDSLVASIDALNLTSRESLTAYPEGCPMHPSWPAMHSAGSAMSLWLAVVMDLSDEQWCQVKLTDYAVAYARTVAGVHFPDDNIAGLNLGQEIIARTLPSFLKDKYGASISNVESKITRLRFDWNDFLESDCAKRSRSS